MMDSTLKEECVKVGDEVMYKSSGYGNIIVKIKDIYVVPNGIKNPELVAVIIAEGKQGQFRATSDKFFRLDAMENFLI